MAFPRWHRDREARLAALRLAGKIDQAGYQDAMARIAGHAPAAVVDAAVIVVPAGDPRIQLARLGVRLPELSPEDLCAAFLLARNGAAPDILVRTLRITPRQAAVIVGSFDR